MEVLSWVHDIPENVAGWVWAGWVVKESGDVVKEAWAHVAGIGSVGEVVLGEVAGHGVEEAVDVIGQHSCAWVSGGVCLDKLGHHGVEHGHLGVQVGLRTTQNTI